MFSDLFLCRIKKKDDCLWEGDNYIFSLPVVKNLKELNFKSNITFFAGENGCGKSTLLEAIAVNMGFNAEGGSRNFNFASCETHSPFFQYIKVSKGIHAPKDGFFLRAESFYNLATEIDKLDEIVPLQYAYGGKSLHSQSHGESFLSLIMNRFGGEGLYILDEPESALSPSGQMTLLARIYELAKAGSQFVIATHSPILMSLPGAEIYVINEEGFHLTEYEKTEHYTLTRDFLNHYQTMLRYLLEGL